MMRSRNQAVLTPLRAIFDGDAAGGATDEELLDRFLESGKGAEGAFARLVDRHGAMVWSICRRLTSTRTDAEDAFQATFLALVRRAASIRVQGSLAPWLFAVARRIGLRSSRQHRREGASELLLELPAEIEAPLESAARSDQIRMLLDELGRLPEKYRAPILLCHLQEKTHREAAETLGWPIGTVRVRLSRGRTLLRDRLDRRGVGVATVLGCGALGPEAFALPPALKAAALRGTFALATHSVAAGTVPAAIQLLEKGAFTPMLTSIKFFLAGATTTGLVALSSTVPIFGWIGEGPTTTEDPNPQEATIVVEADEPQSPAVTAQYTVLEKVEEIQEDPGELRKIIPDLSNLQRLHELKVRLEHAQQMASDAIAKMTQLEESWVFEADPATAQVQLSLDDEREVTAERVKVILEPDTKSLAEVERAITSLKQEIDKLSIYYELALREAKLQDWQRTLEEKNSNLFQGDVRLQGNVRLDKDLNEGNPRRETLFAEVVTDPSKIETNAVEEPKPDAVEEPKPEILEEAGVVEGQRDDPTAARRAKVEERFVSRAVEFVELTERLKQWMSNQTLRTLLEATEKDSEAISDDLKALSAEILEEMEQGGRATNDPPQSTLSDEELRERMATVLADLRLLYQIEQVLLKDAPGLSLNEALRVPTIKAVAQRAEELGVYRSNVGYEIHPEYEMVVPLAAAEDLGVAHINQLFVGGETGVAYAVQLYQYIVKFARTGTSPSSAIKELFDSDPTPPSR